MRDVCLIHCNNNHEYDIKYINIRAYYYDNFHINIKIVSVCTLYTVQCKIYSPLFVRI